MVMMESIRFKERISNNQDKMKLFWEIVQQSKENKVCQITIEGMYQGKEINHQLILDQLYFKLLIQQVVHK